MRVQLRIVSGSLRGRRVTADVQPELRPTPDMVREALFSILGNAVPDRIFVDIFGGTGIIGMEALSRGAKQTLFVERDVRLAQNIEKNLQTFQMKPKARIFKTDAYRWLASWEPPEEAVNVFLSPPFIDLSERTELMTSNLLRLQEKLAPDSLIVLQSERDAPFDRLPEFQEWERRSYSRNVLFLWQKAIPVPEPV